MSSTSSKVGAFETAVGNPCGLFYSIDDAGLICGRDYTLTTVGSSRRVRARIIPANIEIQKKLSDIFWDNNWMNTTVRYLSPERLAVEQK